MEDRHTHNHNHAHVHGNSKNIAVAFLLNFTFTIIELIGGLLTNSVAILSDALHDFGDSISLALAWYFQKISGNSPNARYSYGYKRFALLGALINATVLLFGSLFVIYASILRIIEPQEVKVVGMFWLAIFDFFERDGVKKSFESKAIYFRISPKLALKLSWFWLLFSIF